jgi:Putative transposase, YhgA-like
MGGALESRTQQSLNGLLKAVMAPPCNLRELLAAVVPHLVDRFDFDHVETVDRSFLLDDWRRRESDLLFRLPWLPSLEEETRVPALVCVLIEHQSRPDPVMALRVLLYAVLYWEREWRAWEAEHSRGEPLRLSPVIPVVFHTGAEPWRTHRALVDLIDGPEALRVVAPRWEPLFWDLAEQTPQELLDAAGEWLTALAVVRAEQADAETFERVFAEVLRRLENLSERENVRWHALLWFVLSWGMRRRPGAERERLLETARNSQAAVSHREEIRQMSETIGQTWEQELLLRGQLRERRESLRMLLEERFGPLPEAVRQRIESSDDLARLRRAFQQALHVASLDDLEL